MQEVIGRAVTPNQQAEMCFYMERGVGIMN
jgi:hypothetical protein